MSLKCTQTKMFAPEPQRRSEDRAAAGSRRVLRNEQKVEYNLKIQGVLFYFSPFSFSLFCSAWLLSASKKKKKKNQSYIQVNFISTQSAFVQWSLKRKREQECRRKERRRESTLAWKPSVLILLPFSCCVVIDWVICRLTFYAKG